jgi:hypothetical protein
VCVFETTSIGLKSDGEKWSDAFTAADSFRTRLLRSLMHDGDLDLVTVERRTLRPAIRIPAVTKRACPIVEAKFLRSSVHSRKAARQKSRWAFLQSEGPAHRLAHPRMR